MIAHRDRHHGPSSDYSLMFHVTEHTRMSRIAESVERYLHPYLVVVANMSR